ncbi:MAG: hypothetical protein ACRDAX_09165 [Propionibacteriaceae bacterium]
MAIAFHLSASPQLIDNRLPLQRDFLLFAPNSGKQIVSIPEQLNTAIPIGYLPSIHDLVRFNRPINLISFHLKVLVEAGLIERSANYGDNREKYWKAAEININPSLAHSDTLKNTFLATEYTFQTEQLHHILLILPTLA